MDASFNVRLCPEIHKVLSQTKGFQAFPLDAPYLFFRPYMHIVRKGLAPFAVDQNIASVCLL
jgi:hypothetical protein